MRIIHPPDSFTVNFPQNQAVTVTNTSLAISAINTPISVSNFVPSSSANVTTFTSNLGGQILPSNPNRKVCIIFNSSPNTLYIRLGTGLVSSTNYSFLLGEKEALTLSNITVAIQGIYAVTAGVAKVTELS